MLLFAHTFVLLLLNIVSLSYSQIILFHLSTLYDTYLFLIIMSFSFTFKTGLESLQEEAGENLPEDIADNDSEEDDEGKSHLFAALMAYFIATLQLYYLTKMICPFLPL